MVDELAKSQKAGFSVIPAKDGIQFFPPVMSSLDSGFHRNDDFLRDHQWLMTGKLGRFGNRP
jgi:hypothetical protein